MFTNEHFLLIPKFQSQFNPPTPYRLGGIDFETWELVVGMPQGSYLWSLLFLIYISDLSNDFQSSTVSIYDDAFA